MKAIFTLLESGCFRQVFLHTNNLFDSRPKGHGFKPHLRHCVVVLEQDTFILAIVLVQPRKTLPFITERLLMGHKESNQTNKTNNLLRIYFKDNCLQLTIL